MQEFKYSPDKDIKVHEEGAIRLLCKPFQSHENGLPEWLKNAADAYAREDTLPEKRIILVILDSGRSKIKPSISCLDFVGMSSNEIENHFRIWADPGAATRGSGISWVQGGHGNGGKCYMTQMFDEYSYIHTVKGDKGNKYGVGKESFLFGYIPNRDHGRDFYIESLVDELEPLLKEVRCKIEDLPTQIIDAFNLANGFTLIKGVGPKGYGNRIPIAQIIDDLQDHPQMIRTLELCSVYVIANGRLQNSGSPISLPSIEPIEGSEKGRIITIPSQLKDPHTGQKVTMTCDDAESGTLTLYTSKVSMRYSKKGRHNIIYKTSSGYIGYIPVVELDVQSSYRDRIYGECFLESLEPYKQNDRSRLARSPITRAAESFISQKLEEYAKTFEDKDKYKYDREEKDALSRMNEALDKWKNRFLDEYMKGLWGLDGDGPPPPPPPLPSGKPVRVDIHLTCHRAGLGVSFRPTIKFFDSDGNHIRPTPYRWVSEDTNVAMVYEDILMINTFSIGETSIYAETLDGKIRSNKAPLKVLNIRGIDIFPSSLDLVLGSRSKLEARCTLSDGSTASDVYLIWTESDPNVVRVSSSGLVYGFKIGESEVVAGDDHCMSSTPAKISVTQGNGSGKGDKKGRGFPQVLVSGEIDKDPVTNEYVHFSKDDPPVHQRPQDVDRNIWWINSSSPLARLYLNKHRGYGYETQAWRMYHLERFIDIIVQIALTHGPTETENISVNEWIMKWGKQVSEIQDAAVVDLADFLTNGDLPV